MNAKKLAIILVAFTTVAIVAVVGGHVFFTKEAHVELNRDSYPTKGIDISAHNGSIDFKKVAAAGIDFVFIKISEGATWRDAMFEQNYRDAAKTGLHVGVYHFFRFDVEGWRQSVNILRAINGLSFDLPVAIDVEEWGNPGEYTTDEIVVNLRSLVELLRQNGREPIIYTNKNGYYRFIRGRFDDVALWICSFTTPPISEQSRWTIWQHSHLGKVDGIQGSVDLCTFNTPRRGSFVSWLATFPAIAKYKVMGMYNE